MLTKKQYELLKFINKRLNQVGISPSFDEMKIALNLKSKSGIHRLITGLEERGYIKRLPHRARALEVIKLPKIDVKQLFLDIENLYLYDGETLHHYQLQLPKN